MCLAPAFTAQSLVTGEHIAGAIDQPGSTISTMGDGYADVTGQRGRVESDQLLTALFKQRVYLMCDGEIEAFVDWGYALNARLGQAAYAIAPHIAKNLAFEVHIKDAGDAEGQQKFEEALRLWQLLQFADRVSFAD